MPARANFITIWAVCIHFRTNQLQQCHGCNRVSLSVSVVAAAFLFLAASVGANTDSDKDVGQCGCDIAIGQCDVHCCCDPDCSSEVLGDLRSSFQCLPDGAADTSLHTCYSQSWVHSVNARTDLWVLVDDISGLLCVEVDNNVVKSAHFGNDPLVRASRIDEIREERNLASFADRLRDGAASAELHPGFGYRAGDLLRVQRTIAEDGSQVLEIDGKANGLEKLVEVVGALPLRTPGVLGTCAAEPGQSVRFMVDVPPVSCWLEDVDLRSACTTTLSPSKHSDWFLRKIHLAEATLCAEDRCVAPTFNTNCSDAEKAAGMCLPDDVGAGPKARAATLLEDKVTGACTCVGAVRDVRYVFHYGFGYRDDALAITKVEIRMQVQDVASQGCGLTRVKQGSEVRFVRDVEGVPSLQRRSGNPGYQVGLPLLVATCLQYEELSGKCEVYDSTVAGPSNAAVLGVFPDGSCASKKDARRTLPLSIGFGEDALFGCVLSLNRSELTRLCQEGVLQLGERLGILDLGEFSQRWTAVAAYGVMRDVQDLIEIEAQSATDVLKLVKADPWQVATSTCDGAVVGVDLEILYSPFGEAHNPQARIVAAKRSFRVGALTYTRPNPAERQAFDFTHTVSFVRLDDGGEPEAQVPPRPQLPIWLPRDLFYPFDIASSADRCAWRPKLGLLIFVAQVLVFR
eukprot:TRINITY_DN27048_c0_g2_i1.p1 TRINITY_DN27048_c0_g2~~TRINITY_DN27048_c0_g2_i1.p1  ORF type:complete len:685 (+),score=101.16 TRINITY_DN27048_c0_g2_i1:149-2203(+)